MNLKNQTADLEAKAALKKLIWLMDVLPDWMRVGIIEQILSKYCQYCGSADGYRCSCMNDE